MGNDSDAAALWRCQYSAWSDALKDHILPARCIPLPDAFVKFLLSDGVYVGDENRVIAQARRGSADFETDFGVRAKVRDAAAGQPGPPLFKFYCSVHDVLDI